MNTKSFRTCSLVSAALAALLLAACTEKIASKQEPVSVRYVLAKPAEATREHSGAYFLGIVRGDTETLLAFKVPGQLIKIGATNESEDWREGTPVEKGTVLARLDPADYINAVNASKARAEYTRAAFLRHAELFAAASLSKNDFDASRAQKDTAAADLAHSEQNLRDTIIVAPYSGVLLSRYAKTGEVAPAGKPVLRIADFTQVAIEVGVPETLLREVAVAQSYPIKLTAFEGEAFTGTVSEIGSAAAEGSRLFRVILKVPNPDGRLKSGMTASVRLGHTLTPTANSVIVPLSALFSEGEKGNAAVYVVGDDSLVHLRRIRTGDLVSSSIVITNGLNPNDKVVTVGTAQIHDGARVSAALDNR